MAGFYSIRPFFWKIVAYEDGFDIYWRWSMDILTSSLVNFGEFRLNFLFTLDNDDFSIYFHPSFSNIFKFADIQSRAFLAKAGLNKLEIGVFTIGISRYFILLSIG